MWNVKKKRPGDVILAKLRMTNGDGDYIDPIHHEVFKEGKDRHPLFYLDQLDIKMVSNNLYERKSHEQDKKIPVMNVVKWCHIISTCAPNPENIVGKRNSALNQYIEMRIVYKFGNFMAENQG